MKFFDPNGDPIVVRCNDTQRTTLLDAGVTSASVELYNHHGVVIPVVRFDGEGGVWSFQRLDDRRNSHGETTVVVKLVKRLAYW